MDAEDANFIVTLHEIFPNGERHPVRRFGALKASFPLDEKKSKPWYPVHDYTRKVAVKPGEINEYVIEINPISAVIHPGHSLELEIKAMDPHPYQNKSWSGKVGSMGPIPTAHTVHYKIYRDADYQSYIDMPLITRSDND